MAHVVRLVNLTILLFVMACFHTNALWAQTPMNRDYFMAGRDPKDLQSRRDLLSTDKHHTSRALRSIHGERPEFAIEDLLFTLDRFPNHPDALRILEVVTKLTNKPQLSISYYDKALKLFPQYAITHAQYGAYLVDIGFIDVGILKLKDAIERDPKLVFAYNELAKAYLKNGQQELARQAAEQAKALGHKVKIPDGAR